MKKKIMIDLDVKLVIFLISLIIITACTKGSSSSKPTKDIDVRVGFNGLVMEFLKNTPPLKIFEYDTFPVIIKVKNNGAYTIQKEEVALLSLGIEKDYTKALQLQESGNVRKWRDLNNIASFNIEGKSNINVKGEEEVISYSLQAGNIDPQSEAHSSTVNAVLCYPYKTELDTGVCIDPDISSIRPGKKVCKVQDLVFSNGQGAPVSITKIEVSMLPSIDEQGQESKTIIPQFLLFIENKGQGTVISKDKVKDFCTQSATLHKDLNIVNIKAELSGKQLDCRKSKKDAELKEIRIEDAFVKLKDKKELTRCTLVEGLSATQDAYLSPLNIELTYGYTQSISANYFIQKTAR